MEGVKAGRGLFWNCCGIVVELWDPGCNCAGIVGPGLELLWNCAGTVVELWRNCGTLAGTFVELLRSCCGTVEPDSLIMRFLSHHDVQHCLK